MLDGTEISENLKKNISLAENYLKKFQGRTMGHFINGEIVDGKSENNFQNISPLDLNTINEVNNGSPEDIDMAAKAALKTLINFILSS